MSLSVSEISECPKDSSSRTAIYDVAHGQSAKVRCHWRSGSPPATRAAPADGLGKRGGEDEE